MAKKFPNVDGQSKYHKTQYDMSFREEWTRTLLSDIEDLLLNGYQEKTITIFLCDELGFKLTNARNITRKAESLLYQKGADRKKLMLSKNIVRLEHLYNQCVQQGDITNALKTIELLNKTCGIYTNQIEITNHQFQFNLTTDGDTNALPLIEENTEIVEEVEIIEENNVIDESN